MAARTSFFSSFSFTYFAMLSQNVCTFHFTWGVLLGLHPRLEGVIDEAPTTKGWVQNFSSALVRIDCPSASSDLG